LAAKASKPAWELFKLFSPPHINLLVMHVPSPSVVVALLNPRMESAINLWLVLDFSLFYFKKSKILVQVPILIPISVLDSHINGIENLSLGLVLQKN
jgi:hypothetical protein